MGTSYAVHCLDCEENGFEIDKAENTCREVLGMAEDLAAIAPLLPNLLDNLTVYDRPVYPEWFAKHKGHRLVMMDGYGRIDGNCEKWGKCKDCGHQTPCVLPRHHEGECQVKKR